eukprot:scaffold153147_cov31-Tisochrysis_lutea.AAC.1
MSELERRGQPTGALVRVPTPGPRFFTAIAWWAFGLYALHFASAPYTPTPMEEQRYNELMSAAVFSEEARQAERNLILAQRAFDEVHVWGWRFRSPYAQLVPERRAILDHAIADFRHASSRRDALVSEAKSTVGIWSPHGVADVRETFWRDFEWGKDFAKRMSFWDIVFGIGGSNRDDELAIVLLRWLGQILMNFTVGFASALVSFTFSLVYLIWEYKTGLLSGVVFFAIAITGASAVVAVVISGMYSTAVGGVYLIARSAQQARLQDRAERQPRYVRNHHYGHAMAKQMAYAAVRIDVCLRQLERRSPCRHTGSSSNNRRETLHMRSHS